MKKRILGLAALSALITLSTATSAFAGWVQEADGWRYYYTSTSYAGCGWFTDPDTGNIYHLDPDGYTVTSAYVEGYWMDENGIRHDKSEAQKAAEEKKKKEAASKPSPGKAKSAANEAALATRTGTMAHGTTRMMYQSEMKGFMKVIYRDIRIANENKNITGHTKSNSNSEFTYCFHNSDNREILVSTIWNISNKKNMDYKEQAFDLMYDSTVVSEETDVALFESGFGRLVTAALGDNTGAAIISDIASERAAGSSNFERSGNTDTGNSYTLKYRNGIFNLTIICSEITAPENTENTDEAAGEETAAEETTAAVIVAGQSGQTNTEESAAAEETTAAAEESAAAENTAAEETTAAETAAEETTAAETESAAQ